MQAALQSDATVQQYIDSMLFDGSVDEQPGQQGHAQPPGVPASPVAPLGATRPQAPLPAGPEPMASAASMAALDRPELNALRAAIRSAPPGRSSATAPHSVASANPQPVSQAKPAPSPAAEARKAAASVSSNVNASDAPAAPERGAAFLKHLEAAQQRTGQRLGGVARQRPSSLAKAPAWVDSENLRCLVFRVANLQLALPVGHLAGIAALDTETLQAPCAMQSASMQAAFTEICLGMLDGELVLDTARVVMPERYLPAMREQYRQALRVKGMHWHFAVDSVGSEQTFNVQEVRWRSQHTRREWLAGTVIDRMCAIIDVDALHRSLLAASVLDET